MSVPRPDEVIVPSSETPTPSHPAPDSVTVKAIVASVTVQRADSVPSPKERASTGGGGGGFGLGDGSGGGGGDGGGGDGCDVPGGSSGGGGSGDGESTVAAAGVSTIFSNVTPPL